MCPLAGLRSTFLGLTRMPGLLLAAAEMMDY
jgi:hypothetical protein